MKIVFELVNFLDLEGNNLLGEFIFKFNRNETIYYVFLNDEYHYIVTLNDDIFKEVHDSEISHQLYESEYQKFTDQENLMKINIDTPSGETIEGSIIFEFDIDNNHFVVLNYDESILVTRENEEGELITILDDELKILMPVIKQYFLVEIPGSKISELEE